MHTSGVFSIFAKPRYWIGASPIGRGSNPSQRYEVAPPLRTIRRETVKNPSVWRVRLFV